MAQRKQRKNEETEYWDDDTSAKSTKKAKKDEFVTVTKTVGMGRPKLTLDKKNPQANTLMVNVTGVIDGIRSAVGSGVTEIQLKKAITDAINRDNKKVAEDLHAYMVQKRSDRDVVIAGKRAALSKMKRGANYTEAQKKFSQAMMDLDKEGASQMKQFLIASLNDLEYLELTSEKMNSKLLVERLFCSCMDDLNDKHSSSLLGLPMGVSQEIDYGGYEEEYDVDEDAAPARGMHNAGADDDTQEAGY